jgi:tripeptidyl-peptidase I
MFTKTGRGVPDVSALATNFLIGQGGGSPLTGTSAACPTFAGLVSVINDLLATAGKPTVGFINPVLYASAAGTFGIDITTGNNKNNSCKAGFPAAKGWDPVTGLGTPVWKDLKSMLMEKVYSSEMSFLQ